MNFDPVHDTQKVHRALVQAFSFPCVPVSIEGPASRSPRCDLPPALAAVALTLLDHETSFSHADHGLVAQLTGARRRSDDEADFLLLTVWDEGAWSRSFDRARRGTLSDPHRGATVIAWAPEGVPGSLWSASGAGFERPRSVTLPGAGLWVEARNRACIEFPLGVDLIWVGERTVTALPRTTRLVAGTGV